MRNKKILYNGILCLAIVGSGIVDAKNGYAETNEIGTGMVATIRQDLKEPLLTLLSTTEYASPQELERRTIQAYAALETFKSKLGITSPSHQTPTIEPATPTVIASIAEPEIVPTPTPEPVIAPAATPTPSVSSEPEIVPLPTPEPIIASPEVPTTEPSVPTPPETQVLPTAQSTEPIAVPMPEPVSIPVTESTPTPEPEVIPIPTPEPTVNPVNEQAPPAEPAAVKIPEPTAPPATAMPEIPMPPTPEEPAVSVDVPALPTVDVSSSV
jgi:hypothetical protein